MGDEFTPEQKRYLEGFSSGLLIARSQTASLRNQSDIPLNTATRAPVGPDDLALEAQNRVLRSNRKLSDQEKIKREQHPFDAYDRLKDQAARNEAPKPADNFRWRYYGLFYVAPAQKSYMCRLRLPNGILTHWQFSGVAKIAEDHGGGYCHITTRANLQIREIEPKNAVTTIESVQDLGLCSRGSGADNIRNVTGTPTAGIDPQELLDTRPYARELHFHILNSRTLFGLPRKFNIAFDGGGVIPVLEDTNDIGFQAIDVRNGYGINAGVWFRLLLGGVTGHRDFARETNVIAKPEEATKIADAIIKVFIEEGDRTTRSKARIKYLLDDWGVDRFVEAVEAKLGRKLDRIPPEAANPRPNFNRLAHIGVHPQRQAGLNWIGVVLPVGKLTVEQMVGLSSVSHDFGDGDIRLTVWQNLLISGVSDANIRAAVKAIEALGLSTEAKAFRAGLVACTGSVGCRLASADTKLHADAIASWCESVLTIDSPVNIHLTGCPNSCAQHLISDIGLLATRVEVTDEETIDGYHVYLGGGFGPDAECGSELIRDIAAENTPELIEKLLRAYQNLRTSADEPFLAFARRIDFDALRKCMGLEPSPS
jgi:ferredoxin-nitrite reductase